MSQELVTVVQVIAAVVTTAATIVLAVLTSRYVRLTGGMLEQMRQGGNADVTLDFELSEYSTFLVLSNHGRSPATDIRIDVQEQIPWPEKSITELDAVKHGVSYLAPGRTLKYPLGYLDWGSIKPGRACLNATVRYSSVAGETSRSFSIDFSQFSEVATDSRPEDLIARAIDRTRQAQSRSRIFDFFKKQCSECAEDIKSGAKVCHHCGAEQHPEGQPPLARPVSRRASPHRVPIGNVLRAKRPRRHSSRRDSPPLPAVIENGTPRAEDGVDEVSEPE